ncbi:MAG TPA: L-seryl-tRNA(Sec) selenium transferase, partial [Firmicutes bacterium]|nr:L-seryl-tRNA(Sec) selenium transferase [Bacillota bacterium]
MTDSRFLLRALPPVDRILKEPPLPEMLAELPRPLVVEAVQQVVECYRSRIESSAYRLTELDLAASALAQEAARQVEQWLKPGLRPVINATGIILHTNLGRSPLPAAVIKALTEVASGYSNLEYSLDSGERGSRQEH